MRKFIFLLILFLAVVFVFLSFSELEGVVHTLERSNPIFLSVALFFECIWLYNVAITYAALYRLMDIPESRLRLLLLASAANFVNVIAPSAGLGGMAIFLDSARQRNQPTGRVTVVGVLYVLYDYAAFLAVLALGLIVLFRRNNLNGGEITASAILLLIAFAIGFILYLGYHSSEQLGRVLVWLARLVNRLLYPFLHREYLDVSYAYYFAQEVAEGVAMLRKKPRQLLWPFLFALNNKALLICVLAFTFLALGTPFSVGTLVGGFSIAYLFFIVSPTPSGVGVVESIMPVALTGLRVPWAAAVLITLVYRAVTFWFPLLVGAVSFRILQSQAEIKRILADDTSCSSVPQGDTKA
ncbi:MAG: flippase-like domain-containing protein [Anaerolineales bacterium]|nr:flippase-like domain-containing protein [Anaerolineales bacterium]MDW8228151.1 lysylphosphatidylglycerol synthase transmembrane domain-containing protein [Anaerolineales bacterium]